MRSTLITTRTEEGADLAAPEFKHRSVVQLALLVAFLGCGCGAADAGLSAGRRGFSVAITLNARGPALHC